LPKVIRDRLALRQGDRFQVSIAPDGSVTLAREELPALDAAYGMLRRLARRKPASIAEMRTAVRRRAARRHSARKP